MTVGAVVVIAIILIAAGIFYVGSRSGTTTNAGPAIMTPGLLNATLPAKASSSVTIKSSGAGVQILSGAGTGPSGGPGYSPDTITVVIGVNNTVTWTNGDTIAHTVASKAIPSGAKAFTSPSIAPGGTYAQTFTVAGIYAYYCVLHSWMMGTVTVKSG